MKVSSGTLTIGEGSQLAAYGGGNIATTSVGGAAVILDNGTISGAGTLIAVAGRGDGDNGGNAVEGTGNVEIAKAYLEGGSTSVMNKMRNQVKHILNLSLYLILQKEQR